MWPQTTEQTIEEDAKGERWPMTLAIAARAVTLPLPPRDRKLERVWEAVVEVMDAGQEAVTAAAAAVAVVVKALGWTFWRRVGLRPKLRRRMSCCTSMML
jgi:hypothetical protein